MLLRVRLIEFLNPIVAVGLKRLAGEEPRQPLARVLVPTLWACLLS